MSVWREFRVKYKDVFYEKKKMVLKEKYFKTIFDFMKI